jgi:N,N'-diacetylchitobiose transport system substrate-binding protein
MTKYMAAGAFADLTSKKSQFDNSGTWLQSLAESATFDGKTYGVPYYAGARAVIYRTDLFKAAGVEVPTTREQLEAVAQKLTDANTSDKNFSAFYLPGKNWYAAMAFVYDDGGKIAEQSGDAWKGTLDSSQAQEALTWLKGFTAKYSKADKTGDEAKQDQAFAQGHIAMMIANGWEWGSILDGKNGGNPALADKLGAFPVPSGSGKDFAPSFLGGSDLAVTAKSKAQDAAADWIAAYTSNDAMTELATKGKVIPNTTSLVSINAADPQLAPFAKAATQSWFVPTSPNWATVESSNVLQDMLVAIYTGKQSVADATKKASDSITTTLANG